MNNILRLLKYKHHQKTFCKKFIKTSKEKPEYKYYLRHKDKKSYRESFVNIAVYDVLDNYGFKKLINGIYKMKNNKKQFSADTNYINRRLNNINYINKDSFIRGWGLIGEIAFNDHKWFSKLTITYTSNNSAEIIVKYDFHFKKIISSSFQIHQFVLDELKQAKKEIYFHSYANIKLIEKGNFKNLYECDYLFFCDILQSYICKYFFSYIGKENKLPVEFCICVSNFKSFKKFILNEPALLSCYKNDTEKELLCISSYYYDDRYLAFHYCKGPYLPNSILLSLFSDMSMEFYFQVFSKIEEYELEKHMRKYLNSRKRFVSNKDIKWLINKIRLINEQKNEIGKIVKHFNKHSKWDTNEWFLVLDGKRQDEKLIQYPKYLSEFENMYNNNLEFLKSISATQNDKVVIVIALATLIATIIGIGVTVALNILLTNSP